MTSNAPDRNGSFGKADNRLSFTRARLAGLEAPVQGRKYYYDEETPSLACCVTSTGNRTFYVYRKMHGRPIRVRLGRIDELSVDQARKRALKLIGDMVQGINPQEHLAALRREATVKDLFTHWLETHAKPHKKTWREDQRQFDKLLAGWHSRRLSTVRQHDIRALHARIGKQNGHYAANRLLALVRAMFARASEIGFDGKNPAKGVKKFKEQARDRFLQPDELPKFFKAVDAEENPTLRDFFLICLYTGARRSNVAAMRWDEVNLQSATWRIPDTKNGEPLTVPLSPQALAILNTRKKHIVNDCCWVFPGGRKNQKGHLTSPKSGWERLISRGKFSDLRLHDLRRTLGSYQAANGASLTVIGKSLGQKSQASTAIYARLNLDPVRASVTAATSAIFEAANGTNARRKRQRRGSDGK